MHAARPALSPIQDELATGADREAVGRDPSGPQPDLVTRDSRAWRNLQGYFVRVIAAYPTLDRIETIILSVPFLDATVNPTDLRNS